MYKIIIKLIYKLGVSDYLVKLYYVKWKVTILIN